MKYFCINFYLCCINSPPPQKNNPFCCKGKEDLGIPNFPPINTNTKTRNLKAWNFHSLKQKRHSHFLRGGGRHQIISGIAQYLGVSHDLLVALFKKFTWYNMVGKIPKEEILNMANSVNQNIICLMLNSSKSFLTVEQP